MSDSSFSLIALAVMVLMLTGMVVVFARRAPWFAPFRDPRIGELVAEVKVLRSRINALAEAQDRLLRRLEEADARSLERAGDQAVKLVLFDVDGTLIDSQHLIVAAMDGRLSARTTARRPRATRILSVVGLSLPQAFAMLAGDDPAFPAASFADAYKQAFFRLSADPAQQAPLFPGAKAVIDALARRDDVTLGLATGKSRRGVDRMLDLHGLEDVFATVQTADDHPSKPAPDMVLAAMAEAGAGADETVLLGDTTFDMEMTRAAGALPIGAGWGYHPAGGAERRPAPMSCSTTSPAFLPAFERLCDTRPTNYEQSSRPSRRSRRAGRSSTRCAPPSAPCGRNCPSASTPLSTVAEGEDGWAVRSTAARPKTPRGQPLAVPTRALAEALAAEWSAQGRGDRPRHHAADPAGQRHARRGGGRGQAAGRHRRDRQICRLRPRLLPRRRAGRAGGAAGRGVGPGARRSPASGWVPASCWPRA